MQEQLYLNMYRQGLVPLEKIQHEYKSLIRSKQKKSNMVLEKMKAMKQFLQETGNMQEQQPTDNASVNTNRNIDMLYYRQLASGTIEFQKGLHDYKNWVMLSDKGPAVLAKMRAWEKFKEEYEAGKVAAEIPNEEEDGDDAGVLNFDELVARKYLQIMRSAKKRNKEFNLSLADVRSLCRRKTCYYTGLPFSTGDFKRTFDRRDANIGYVKGNVVACSHFANVQKNILLEVNGAPFKDNKKLLLKFVNSL